MLNTKQIDGITNFAKSHFEIAAVYLFGSHASDHERARSDIDLGILFIDDMDGFKRIDLETEISNTLKKDVDLVDIRKCGPFLRHQIYKHGQLIYHNETDFPFLFRAQSLFL